MLISLTEEERAKFGAYCLQEARSYTGLVLQTEKLPGGTVLSTPMKQTAAAYAVVARHLGSAEIHSIGKKG